jgi:hypothetical protein
MQTDFATLAVLRLVVGSWAKALPALAIAIVGSTQQKDRNFAFLVAAQVVLGVVMFLLLPFPADAAASASSCRWPDLRSSRSRPSAGYRSRRRAPAITPRRAAARGTGALAVCWSCSSAHRARCGVGVRQAYRHSRGHRGGGSRPGARAVHRHRHQRCVAASALADRFGRILPVSIALPIQAGMVSSLRPDELVAVCGHRCSFPELLNLTGP